MPTKAKPAAKKAAPKAKAKPMAKKKKPAAKKPARRPLHEGGMIDADLLAEQTKRDALENNRNPQRTGPRYVDTATGGSRPSNFTPGPRRPQRIGQPAMYPDGSRPPSRFRPTPTPMGPRAGGAINPNPTRVPLNQPFMDRRPPRGAPDLRPNPQAPVNTTDRYLPTSSRFGPRIPNPNYVNTTDRFTQESGGPRGRRIPNPNYVNTTDRYLPTSSRFGPRIPNPNYRPPVPNPNSFRGRRTLEQTNRAANQARFTRPQVTPQQAAAAAQMQRGRNAGTTPRPMNKGGMVLTPEQYQRAAALTRPKNKRR
jgi:hypothetical protein